MPAGEVSWGWSTSVAVCGELVTSAASSGDDEHYRVECVHEALRWCARPVPVSADISGARTNDR
jgi:hypothetical protein